MKDEECNSNSIIPFDRQSGANTSVISLNIVHLDKFPAQVRVNYLLTCHY